MMKIVILCILAVVWLQRPTEGNAVCCRKHAFLLNGIKGNLCDDCSTKGTYCSRTGSCNIFGCNCDGGCKTGICNGTELTEEGKRANPNARWVRMGGRYLARRSVDAHDVIRTSDAVEDYWRMSLEEAPLHLGNT